MQAGKLDRKISIERRTDTQDEVGQPIPSWARIGETRWAQRTYLSDRFFPERFVTDQRIARDQIEWAFRWASDLADLNPKDRIVYPVTSSPSDAEIYDIVSVHEDGRRRVLKVVTMRRSEQ